MSAWYRFKTPHHTVKVGCIRQSRSKNCLPIESSFPGPFNQRVMVHKSSNTFSKDDIEKKMIVNRASESFFPQKGRESVLYSKLLVKKQSLNLLDK